MHKYLAIVNSLIGRGMEREKAISLVITTYGLSMGESRRIQDLATYALPLAS